MQGNFDFNKIKTPLTFCKRCFHHQRFIITSCQFGLRLISSNILPALTSFFK
ncbi:hypothetical protein [Moraxella lacunata]|uniref:hypothetical protein n=1 Tax=Moraxella lacunata TaxID=477 RepID=UPI003EE3B896